MHLLITLQVVVRVHDACFTSGKSVQPLENHLSSWLGPQGHPCLSSQTHTKAMDHIACTSAEVLGSLKCDCAEQLKLAMEYIQEHRNGIIIYLQQEGRGIGLSNKIAAYSLQVQSWQYVFCCMSRKALSLSWRWQDMLK